MKVAVVVFPGSNCDRDATDAFATIDGCRTEMIWHRESELPATDLVVLPGGFSYGDYLRTGAIAAHSPIMDAVIRAARRGVPTLGICNGFQILTECGLLPGILMRNESLRFVCRPVHLRVEAKDCIFTHGYAPRQVIRIPVSHHDGNYFAEDAVLDRLEGEGRVAFRYTAPPPAASAISADGSGANESGIGEYNPNGSARDIAGIIDENRRILGLMPHPDRAVGGLRDGSDGLAFVAGLAEALA